MGIQKSDVKVYLKAIHRGKDCLKKWSDACEKAGLDYVFALKGWGSDKPVGSPVDTFDWKNKCSETQGETIVYQPSDSASGIPVKLCDL